LTKVVNRLINLVKAVIVYVSPSAC
jgi:hypothetical protein